MDPTLDIKYTDHDKLEELLLYNSSDDSDYEEQAKFYYQDIIRTPISIKVTSDFDNSDFISIPFINDQINDIKKYSISKKNKDNKRIYEVKSKYVSTYHEDEYMEPIIKKIKLD